MATYTVPRDAEIIDLVAGVIKRYHGELLNAEVTIGLLAYWPGEDDDEGGCLKLHGYPCAATIKVTPYRQRVQGIADAVITLNGPTWEGLSDRERIALIDHELTHLELVRDKDGAIKTDDAGRPKLRLRIHDFQVGGFESVLRRHGKAALEGQEWRRIHGEIQQLVFAWASDEGEATAVASVRDRSPGRTRST